jgi:ribonuclease R
MAAMVGKRRVETMTKKSFPRRDEVLDLLATKGPRALHARELASALNVREGDYLRFLSLLEELTLDGAIRAQRGQRYGAVRGARGREAREVREGRVRVHPRGFGFVCSAGVPDDVYVQGEALGGAMHGDMVRVEVMARSWRGLEGRVLEILQRANARVQGVLRKTRHGAWLEVDDARVRGPIVLHGEVDGEDGDAAVVEIVRFPETGDENPEGKLLAALGPPGSPDVETRKVLLRQGIEETFSEAVQQEVERVAKSVDPSSTQGREDLREVDLLTIDPADARDRDDAIWVRELDDGFESWVAIADVAAYVQPGTALDDEARIRGFSLYLPDRAVPMLPATLSSKLCSLEKDEDRLCMALWMKFDDRGRRTRTRLCEAIMRSTATLSYRQVAVGMKWSSEPGDALEPGVAIVIEQADELSRLLRRRRMRRGALELSAPEPEILLDPDSGMPVDVVRRAEDPGVKRAYQLIEELMVAANEAVAEWLQEGEEQAIYRVHPPPSEARLVRLAELCSSLEIPFEYEDAADPKRLGKFLRSVQEHPLVEIIGMLALRSLAPASYDTVNVGHYGLASRAYAHFTSPIRRYPDLVIHRRVKGRLRKEPRELVACQDIAMHCTRREREIVDVEREVFDVYRCVMMRDRVGMRGWGVVTDIGTSSVTVTLEAPFVEVLVPEGLLGRGGYERSEDGLHLVAQRSGDRISLGSRMEVEVESADITRRVTTGKRILNKETSGKTRIDPKRLARMDREARKRLKHKKKV